MEKILLFSPFQGIPEHSFLEKFVLDTLQENELASYDVVTCDGTLQHYCVMIGANGGAFKSDKTTKDHICRKCRRYRDQNYGPNFEGHRFDIESEVDPKIETILNKEHSRIQEQTSNYSYDSVPLGRISAYELILNHKLKSMTNLSPDVLEEYARTIYNNLKIFLVVGKILKQNSYDRIFAYNGNYVMNNTISHLLRRHHPKIVFTSLHYGFNWSRPRDKFYLTNRSHPEHYHKRSQFFKDHLNNVDRSDWDVLELKEYLADLQNAKSDFIYSSAQTNRSHECWSRLGLDPKKPTAMVSMSSTDELLAAQFSVTQGDKYSWSQQTFRDQLDWIEQTVEYFSKHPEWQLIIRVHPREYPNKRERVRSQITDFYEKMLSSLPSNIAFNTPENRISIYDLFELIHLNLTSWSTVGLESSLFGVPTLSMTREMGLYPTDYVHFYYPEASGYFNKISEVLSLSKQTDQELAKRAETWQFYDFNNTVIRLETSRFWEKRPSLIRRFASRTNLPLSLRTYQEFSKNVLINADELNVLQLFFTTHKDIFETKVQLD